MKVKKNPHATALGKLGGRKRMDALSPAERKKLASEAGTARAKKLSAQRRKEIAKLAVAARERKRAEKKVANG